MPVDFPLPPPVEVNLAHLLVSDGIDVALVTIPAHATEVAPGFPASAVGPGILWRFRLAGLGDRCVSVIMPRDYISDELGAELGEVLGKLHDEALLDAIDAQARTANGTLGRLPEPVEVRCPGCGLRIFGTVAVRGACRDCYPELPIDAGADLPDGGTQ